MSLTTRQVVGMALLAGPVIGLGGYAFYYDWRMAATTLGVTTLIILWVTLAAWLIAGGEP